MNSVSTKSQMSLLKKICILFVCSVIIAFSSCEELPCTELDGVNVNASFYTYDGVSLADTVIRNLIIHYGLEEQRIYSDTLLGKSENTISFPLSMLDDSSIVIFEFDYTTFDTLIFHYNKYLHLESHKCGFVEFFELTDVEERTSLIDSVWISNSNILYGDKENIKIYF